MYKIKIIIGSTREGRAGERVAIWFNNIAEKQRDWQVEVLDLKALGLPVYDEAQNPKKTQGDYKDIKVRMWSEKIREADGYIVVTPEYNHGYPAMLKNAFDWLYIEWNNKPIGFVSYGGAAGGSRAVEQLREVAIELQMAPIRNQVVLPHAYKISDEELKDSNNTESANGVIQQLDWWAKALKVAREATE